MTQPQPEQWRSVVGWEGLYSVSDQGRLRSEPRAVHRPDGGVHRRASRILSPGRTVDGYQVCCLRALPRKQSVYVHNAVLEAFCGPAPEGTVAQHRNHDRADNRLENLVWGQAQRRRRPSKTDPTAAEIQAAALKLRGAR